ncbi:unnamed protein product [Chrysodeixis includens]|uniref:Uncharacterized protein n=1 Tax=Chrysodeixis includens TaxID=689277 RepID=A0A9P0BT87_CHRIL|nr:unnamed protein product [Chrysodeixis includens]
MRVSFRRDASNVAIYKALKCVSEHAEASSRSASVQSTRRKMHKITLFIFAALFAVTLAEGQYYVPRAYYTIDAEGHESARVPLRRLRRSVPSFPYGLSGANANANAEANADGDAEANANAEAHAYNGGSANANANANAQAGGGPWDGPWGWGLGSNGGSNDFPTGKYGSANPNALRH